MTFLLTFRKVTRNFLTLSYVTTEFKLCLFSFSYYFVTKKLMKANIYILVWTGIK